VDGALQRLYIVQQQGKAPDTPPAAGLKGTRSSMSSIPAMSSDYHSAAEMQVSHLPAASYVTCMAPTRHI
jgi:hypothetical protein